MSQCVFVSLLAAIIFPVDGYEVTGPKTFVYCKLWAAGLKLGRFAAPYALTSEV